MKDRKRKAARSLPLLSICIPVMNESENIDLLYERLDNLSLKMAPKCNFEFIFTDNDSTDDTWVKLQRLGEKDERVRAFKFAKNIGFQNSILFNYAQAKGDVVAQIDADLQDPPELIEEFYDLWVSGYQVVYGIRAERKESFLINFIRERGYWLLDVLSEHPMARNAGDFRLLDRKVIDILKSIKTPNPYLRGIVSGLGFRQIGVPYSREKRVKGKSKIGLLTIIRLGLTGLANHSNVPLRAATFVGLSSLLLSIFGSIYYIIMRLTHPEVPQGFATVYVMILFAIGINSLLLSVIGSYIRKIYVILCAQPLAVVEDTINDVSA